VFFSPSRLHSSTITGPLLSVLFFLGPPACSIVEAQSPEYLISAGGDTVSPGQGAFSSVRLDSAGSSIQAWSFGICQSDPSAVLVDLQPGSTTETVRQGAPADFIMLSMEPGGWTMSVVVCLLGCAVLPPGSDYELARAEYALPDTPGAPVELCPCGSLGTPTIPVSVGVLGVPTVPMTGCGQLEVSAPVEFLRGDANDDGFVDLSDGIWLLNYLFQEGPLRPCLSAADVNGDGGIDAADPIFLLSFIFVGGATPPAPHPGCGLMDGQTPADCTLHLACP